MDPDDCDRCSCNCQFMGNDLFQVLVISTIKADN